MESTNCFALKDKKCIALSGGKCKGRCAFYKTEVEHKASQASALRRIASLPYDIEYKISFAYYGGNMPWHSGVKK